MFIYQVVTSLLVYTLVAQSLACKLVERRVRVRISPCRVFFSVSNYFLLTLGAHAPEGYSTHFARKPGNILLYEGGKRGERGGKEKRRRGEEKREGRGRREEEREV